MFKDPIQTSLMLLLLGLSLFCWEVYSAVRSFQSNNWEPTNGRIVKSEIEVSGYGRRRRSRAVVSYSYVVKGKRYECDNIQFGGLSIGSSIAGLFGKPQVLEDYPKGKSVRVFYNPNNPDDAVLKRKLPASTYVTMIIATLVCSFTAAPLLSACESTFFVKNIKGEDDYDVEAELSGGIELQTQKYNSELFGSASNQTEGAAETTTNNDDEVTVL